VSQAPRAEIYNFEQLAGRVHAEDILRLQIAVDNFALFEEDECFEELGCVRSDLALLEAHELALFQVLEQICVKQFKYEALVLAEVQMLDQANDVVLVFWVFIHEEI